jgi:hypothetical protein
MSSTSSIEITEFIVSLSSTHCKLVQWITPINLSTITMKTDLRGPTLTSKLITSGERLAPPLWWPTPIRSSRSSGLTPWLPGGSWPTLWTDRTTWPGIWISVASLFSSPRDYLRVIAHISCITWSSEEEKPLHRPNITSASTTPLLSTSWTRSSLTQPVTPRSTFLMRSLPTHGSLIHISLSVTIRPVVPTHTCWGLLLVHHTIMWLMPRSRSPISTRMIPVSPTWVILGCSQPALSVITQTALESISRATWRVLVLTTQRPSQRVKVTWTGTLSVRLT